MTSNSAQAAIPPPPAATSKTLSFALMFALMRRQSKAMPTLAPEVFPVSSTVLMRRSSEKPSCFATDKTKFLFP